MNLVYDADFDPALDLKLERIVPVSPALVWAAWTQPDHVVQWFTPAPWKTKTCEIDLRPGGIFRTVMQSPEGDEMDSTGCYLWIEHEKCIIFTDALLPGFRPKPSAFMTTIISIEAHAEGTKYTAIAKHKDEADRQSHEDMGFSDGWSRALDQLVEHMKSI